MSDRPLQVSDHALVRYMERIKGICLDEYRDEIRALVTAHKNNPLPAAGESDEGLVIVVELLGLPVVSTVLGRGMRPKRKNQPFGSRLIYVPPGATP